MRSPALAAPPADDHRRDRHRHGPLPYPWAPGLLGPLCARRQPVGGKAKGRATTGHGNPYLARVLGEAAVAAGRTDTFLGERYRRIARRRGTKKAIVAVGRSILVIVWHLLADPNLRYHDLGPGFYDTHVNAERAKRNHVRQLEALATGSPWYLLPDPAPIHRPGPGSAPLRRVLPPAH